MQNEYLILKEKESNSSKTCSYEYHYNPKKFFYDR